MILPIGTEAHDGKIRMGSIGIIVLCLLVHFFVWRDQSARAQRLLGLANEVSEHRDRDGIGRLIDDVAGRGTANAFEDEGAQARRDSLLAELKARFDKERKATLMYRLALVKGDFHPFNLVTSIFTHADWLHVIFNLWFFYIVGVTMEKYWGMGKFLGLFVALGIAGELAWLAVSGSRGAGVPVVGASGAIAGMMGAFGATHGSAKINMLWIATIRPTTFPLPARWFLGFWIAGQILDGFLHMNEAGGTAYSAHIAGFFLGWLAGKAVPGDAHYEKAYVEEFSMADADKLVSGARLEIPKAAKPAAPPRQDGASVDALLETARLAADRGDRSVAGETFFKAVEKAFAIPDLDARILERALRAAVESVPETLPPGALYAWAHRLEQRDWWQWAVSLYDAVAADRSGNSNPHARLNSLFNAAVLRMDHAVEKPKARDGFQAVVGVQPEGPLAAEARSRLAALEAG